MDDAKIGEGRKETTIFTRDRIEKMGEWKTQTFSSARNIPLPAKTEVYFKKWLKIELFI